MARRHSGLMSKGRDFYFVDDPRRTIEENRAGAPAQGAPTDTMGELAR